MITAHTAFAIAITTALAAAQPFTIDTELSTAKGSLAILAAANGTLIGNYDETTNPTGTQTRPGFFGGSGNNLIPVDLDIDASTGIDLNPAGSFTLNADTGALTFSIDALNADLLNGQTVASTVGLELLYSTFNTVNPTSIYPGGIPLPVELEAGQLTTITIAQSAPMDAGVLIPMPENTWQLAGALPATLTIAGTTFGDAPLEPAPFDILLPITGTYTLGLDGAATIEIAINLDELSQTLDTSTLPPLPEIPFPLPTLTGGTANVLLTLAVSELGFEAGGSLNLIATAEAAGCNAADNAEPFGVLDLADLTAFINAFVAQTEPADLDDNGIYDLTDIQIFINTFLAGCP
jgi:hypothetical protein